MNLFIIKVTYKDDKDENLLNLPKKIIECNTSHKRKNRALIKTYSKSTTLLYPMKLSAIFFSVGKSLIKIS